MLAELLKDPMVQARRDEIPGKGIDDFWLEVLAPAVLKATFSYFPKFIDLVMKDSAVALSFSQTNLKPVDVRPLVEALMKATLMHQQQIRNGEQWFQDE